MTRFTIALLAIAFTFCSASAETATDGADGEKQITTDGFGCRIERYSIYSRSMDKQVKIAVVLPPGYDENKAASYPVVYTLHGARAPYDTFANMSRFRQMLTSMPMIYTCFEGELSCYYDWPADPKMKFTTFFFDEFIPYVESAYRTNGQRGVGGFSMGGTGSLHYMLAKPEMFQGVCVLSSGLRRYVNADGSAAKGAWIRFGDFETHKPFYKSIDSYQRTIRCVAEGVKLPPMMLRCGTEDGAVKGLRQYRDLLIELNQAKRKEIGADIEGKNGSKKSSQIDKIMETEGIDFTYVESPGRHAWPYWHGQAPEFARFFWECFQKSAKAKAATNK